MCQIHHTAGLPSLLRTLTLIDGLFLWKPWVTLSNKYTSHIANPSPDLNGRQAHRAAGLHC